MRIIKLFISISLILTACISAANAKIIVMDDFEDINQWGMTNGGEFPGAIGSINAESNGLVLNYDFTKGGGYVGAVYQGLVISDTDAFIASIHADQNCIVYYRITDANGRVYQAYVNSMKAGETLDLSCPTVNNWEGSWSGNKGNTPQPVAPVSQLWICVNNNPDVPKTGKLHISNFRANIPSDSKIEVSGPVRKAVSFSRDKLSPAPHKFSYFPDEEKLAVYRVYMGYNEPGESANEARDLRISTKDGKYLFGLWGRLQVTGKPEYVTPTDFGIRTLKDKNGSYWEWDNTDARIGFQQVVKTHIDRNGITSTIYLRFLKAHTGTITIPYVVPDVHAQYFSGNGKDIPYKQILNPKRASRVEFNVNDKKLYMLNSIYDPRGVTQRYGTSLWMHFFRSELPLSYIYIRPPDGKTFPKGYVNAIQMRITSDSSESHPLTIEKPEWNNGISLYVMEKDDSGKYVIPRVNRPHIFMVKEKKQIGVALYNMSANSQQNVKLEYILRDYNNHTVLENAVPMHVDANSTAETVLNFPLSVKGIYSLTLNVKKRKTLYAEKICRISVIPAPANIAAKDSFFGIDPLFLEGSKENLNMLRQLGIRWLRLGGGVWFPSEGDKSYLTKLKQNDIGSFLLIESPDLVRGPEYNDLIDYYEICNEPDGWTNPEDYAKVAKTIYEKIKQVNPQTTVLACSVSGGDSDSDFAFTRRFLAAGGSKMCEVIPYHPYASIRAFGPGTQSVSPEENRLYEKMLQGQELNKAAGLRTWVGEVGYLTINSYRFPYPKFHKYEKSYANYMARLFLICKCIPELERVVWFHLCMDDTPLNLFAATYGTYDSMGPNNNITPCLTAYANLASLMDGSRFVKKLKMHYPDIWGVQVNKKGENILALWNPNDACTLTFSYAKNIKKVSIVGTDSVIKPVNGKVTLQISDEPVYLVFPDSQVSLVNRIENSSVVFNEPVAIGSFNKTTDGKLFTSLKNKSDKPLRVDLSLLTSSSKEKWSIQFESGENKELILPCKNIDAILSAKKLMLTAKADGRTSQKIKVLTDQDIKPDLVAIKSAATPVIDGNLDEWKSAVPIVSNKHEQVTPPDAGLWKGPEDLSFVGYFMYDDNYIYFGCRVKDNIHKNNEIPGKIWAGDSIQLGIANQDSPYNYTEVNFGLSSTSGMIGYETLGPDSGKPLEGLKFVAKEGDGDITYEAALPIKSLRGIQIVPGGIIRCAFIVNDIDDTTRKWIAIKDPGLIGANKDAKFFPALLLRK